MVHANLPILDYLVLGPQREVVSIYNDAFATPPSRPQYFIDVYRCVEVDFGECPSSGPSGYPVPENIEKIEIVVPDITNGKVRNSTNKTKFYKYVVYNHTSCKCGTLKFRGTTLYQTITKNEVSKADYSVNCTKNPVNVIHRCHSHVCKPQQRYRFTHIDAVRPSTYLAYKQCLPGSVALKNKTSTNQITLINNKVTFVNLTSDISCKAFNGKNAEPELCPKPTSQNSPNPTTQNITSGAGKQ
ncbi:Hypothetical predicted protein [Paramuricea clavata]|uniref:Uncharacterized protein n=1 Tax=Paramuricea clavata TaxID=317549 RepID=A0A7D9E5T3_PARCT|nr:Hypothetical predicted protein [Paramuricea clavata]